MILALLGSIIVLLGRKKVLLGRTIFLPSRTKNIQISLISTARSAFYSIAFYSAAFLILPSDYDVRFASDVGIIATAINIIDYFNALD